MSRPYIVYIPNHGYTDGDPVLIGGISALANTVYYVFDSDNNSFKLALTDAESPDLLQSVATFYTEGTVRKSDASGTLEVSGLNHLIGQMVYVNANNVILGPFVVDSEGKIDVPSTLYTYTVGLRYPLKAKTTRLEVPTAPTIQSRIKRINEVSIRTLKAVDGQVGQEYDGIEYLQRIDSTFSKKSKDYRVLADGGFNKDGYITIRQNTPLPFGVVSAVISFSVDEG